MLQKQYVSTYVREQPLKCIGPFSHRYRYNPSGIVARHKAMDLMKYSITEKNPAQDDSLIYERILREGWEVSTRVDIHRSVPHRIWMVHPI